MWSERNCIGRKLSTLATRSCWLFIWIRACVFGLFLPTRFTWYEKLCEPFPSFSQNIYKYIFNLCFAFSLLEARKATERVKWRERGIYELKEDGGGGRILLFLFSISFTSNLFFFLLLVDPRFTFEIHLIFFRIPVDEWWFTSISIHISLVFPHFFLFVFISVPVILLFFCFPIRKPKRNEFYFVQTLVYDFVCWHSNIYAKINLIHNLRQSHIHTRAGTSHQHTSTHTHTGLVVLSNGTEWINSFHLYSLSDHWIFMFLYSHTKINKFEKIMIVLYVRGRREGCWCGVKVGWRKRVRVCGNTSSERNK